MKKSLILITGSSGMLGKSLVKKSLYKTFLLLLNPMQLILILLKDMPKNKINFVIHCASKVGGIQDNMNNQVFIF